MHTKIFSATTIGVAAHAVEVEIDLARGIMHFDIVGLPDTAIKESKYRISSALKNSGIRLPMKRITVNLAPADLKKEGTVFDLPIAIGILHADGLLEVAQEFLRETLFLGELSLDGSVRRIKGALAIAYDAQRLGKKRIILPQENAHEAAFIKGIEVIGVENLVQLIGYLRNEFPLEPTRATTPRNERLACDIDYRQVKGQHQAKRALQIAAAGRHNILFIGPPGSGKTMLAKRLATIMPELTFNEVLETSKIYSISGKLGSKPLMTQRPFRSPHHTISQAGLVGGGSFPQPGEISLAHNGILFLDELTEFQRSTLEVLRQPLEHKTVCISRAAHSVAFPASFLLVAALNPCPCGFLGDKKKQCTCSPQQIARYFGKVSGPLLDRIDIQINVQSIEYDTIKASHLTEQSSEDLYAGVQKATAAQQQRTTSAWNAHLTPDLIDKQCQLSDAAEVMMKKAFEKLCLSMRGYHKILKVARTIADLEQADIIDAHHLREAIMYRSLDHNLDRLGI